MIEGGTLQAAQRDLLLVVDKDKPLEECSSLREAIFDNMGMIPAPDEHYVDLVEYILERVARSARNLAIVEVDWAVKEAIERLQETFSNDGNVGSIESALPSKTLAALNNKQEKAPDWCLHLYNFFGEPSVPIMEHLGALSEATR